MKSSEVAFHVQREDPPLSTASIKFPNNTIIFNKMIVNAGNGLDWKNQRFIAPRWGIYSFSVSGSKSGKSLDTASIFILLNGEIIGEAVSSMDNSMYGGFSYQGLRKL